MIKILYAASNTENGLIQLDRFARAIEHKPYVVKFAAYKKSSPINRHIDWTLDCLLDVFDSNIINADNENLEIYFDQIKYYNPDLIISDMEYFTSRIGNVLNIPVWQCSSSLITYGLTQKEKQYVGLYKKYSVLFYAENKHERNQNIINNSDRNFVYSHFGDLISPPQLKSEFQWARPYHTIGKTYTPCIHNVVAVTADNNKKIYDILTKNPDSVAFSSFSDETYSNFLLKDINNYDEYYCNLKNCNLFLCEGQTSFLADAYYNNKFSVVLVKFKEAECVINSTFSEKFNLSHTIYGTESNLLDHIGKNIQSTYMDQSKFLDEYLEEL